MRARPVPSPPDLWRRSARADESRRGLEATIMSDVRSRFAKRFAGIEVLQWIAGLLALGFTGFVTLFVVGESAADPGGWVGIGGPAAWVLLMVGLGIWAAYRPSAALVALAVLACAPLAYGVWSLLAYREASNWEDDHGPISLLLSLAVCAPAAVAGLFRPRPAGYLILAASAGPIVLAAIGAASKFYRPLSIGLLLLPIVVSGVLFVLAARQRRKRLGLAAVPEAAPPPR
jgi:hypothetical protein